MTPVTETDAVPGEVERMSRVRHIIAQRMRDSLRATAQLTAMVEVDLSGVMEARRRWGEQFRDRHGVSLSPFVVVAAAAVQTLADHPKLNSVIDVEAGTITHFPYVNLGVAVDTPDGLLVPNVKDAQGLDIPSLATGIADLAGRARARRLRPTDIEGGTFTVTNTGSRGSMLDTPILNHPEVGILAVGRAVRRPAVKAGPDGEVIVPADMAFLCLTYDHQLVDGADAGRYLDDLRGRLEAPDSMTTQRLGLDGDES